MTTNTRLQFSASEIAEFLNAEISGDGSAIVNGTEFIERATASDLAFVGCSKNANRIATSAAKVIVAPTDISTKVGEFGDRTFLFVDEPETAFLSIAQKLAPVRQPTAVGVSPQAFVAESATVGRNTVVHPFAHIGEGVVVGEDSIIGPGVSIGDDCIIGDKARLDANVVVYANSVLGNNIVINSNSTIGSEGFGYQTDNGHHKRLPHVGNVIIQDDVEIGACTTIDRAKVGSTVIGSGTKIDNSVQIAHNCQIGKHNLLVAKCGIAGSSTTGSHVVVAGQVGVSDHVTIGDGAVFGAQSGVHRDMPGGQVYLGSPARPVTEQTKILTSMRRLPKIRAAVKELHAQVAALQQQMAELMSSSSDVEECSSKAA